MKKFLPVIFSVVLILNNSRSALAANIKDLLYPASTYTGPAGGPTDLSSIYNPIVKFIYIVSGFIVLLGLLYGGFQVISGASSSDRGKIQAGRNAITWSFVGLALLFSVYWIVEIMQLLTGYGNILGGGGI